MNALALPLAIALCGVLAETLFNHHTRRAPVSWLDTIFNLNSGHILMWLFRGIEVYCFSFVLQHASLGWIPSWPLWLQWVFAFLAWDFCFYWLHRLHHEIPFLWAVHVVHHQGEHYNLSLGVRNSWYSSITSIPFFLILAILGLPLPIFITVSSFHYAVQLYNHNSLVKSMGWFEHVLITPAHHAIHHGANPEYVDTNYGGTLLLWDRLFGSFQRKTPGQETIYGVPGLPQPLNPFWASNLPFLRLFGWHKKIPDAPSQWRAPPALVAMAGLTLFGLVIYYVHYDGVWPLSGQALYFVLVFTGTLAIGAMSDGRRWGWRAWFVVSLAIPLLSWRARLMPDHIGPMLMILTVAQGLYSLLMFARHSHDMRSKET